MRLRAGKAENNDDVNRGRVLRLIVFGLLLVDSSDSISPPWLEAFAGFDKDTVADVALTALRCGDPRNRDG